MKVTKLTKSVHMADRWYLELEGGESLKIDLNAIADYSLYVGRELEEDEVVALRESSEKFGAKERALRLLESRQMSRRELIKKLCEKGESANAAESAADLMERIGAVNDREYAMSIVRHYSKRGYGVGRIKQELSRRGIDREMWEEALSELPEDTDAIDELIMRRLRGGEPDKKELKKLTDYLLRRGFSWGEIKSALGRYDEELESAWE